MPSILDRIILFIFLIFSTLSLYSQQREETKTVFSVEVEGNRFTSKEEVKAISNLRSGMVLSADVLNKSVKNLWSKKLFSEVEVLQVAENSLGTTILIRVKELPRLRTVTLKGNDRISEEEIRKTIDVPTDISVSENEIYYIKKKIKKLYEKEGLAFATVTHSEVINDSTGFLTLTLSINEGPDFVVTAINFEGNNEFTDSELNAVFDDIKVKSWWQFWRSNKFETTKFESDKQKLLSFYKKNGFVDAQIVKDTIIFDKSNASITLDLTVYEGQKLYIRSIAFEGNSVYPSEALVRRLNIQPGSAYDQELFNQNLEINAEQTDVKSLYMDIGYLNTRFVPEIKKATKDSIDITVKVFENERATVRNVLIFGNSKTKEKVIRRELFTRPGDSFSRSAIIRSIKGLGVSNFFNPEKLRPNVKPVPGDNTKVDVEYYVEERSTDTFNASVGFAGVFGLTGAIGFTFNNFSISEPFSGGAGQVLNFNWEFGQANRLQTLNFGFTEPWFLDTPTMLGFNIFDTQQNLNFQSRQTGIQGSIGRRFRWPDDYFRGDWSVRAQRNNVGAGLGVNRFFRVGNFFETTFTQTISRISLDNIMFPTSGSRMTAVTQFAAGSIGIGNTDYLRNQFTMEFFNPLIQIDGFNRLVLYLSADMGYVTGINSDTTIPPQNMYFMGGNGLGGFNVTPLRGYPDGNLLGNQSGSHVMTRYVAELRFAVTLSPMPIYFITFAEAGNVWDNLRTTDPFDLKRSAGVGMRIMLQPIGLIGFDYGYGFDSVRIPGQKSGWQFHVQFGR
jgi:outer membrane protein insertion porin family